MLHRFLHGDQLTKKATVFIMINDDSRFKKNTIHK